ncbi:MAG: DUF2252 domain-containing protein [Lachnospiraceae bacterium]
MPEKLPEKAVEKLPEKMVEKLPEKVIENLPEKVLEKLPQQRQIPIARTLSLVAKMRQELARELKGGSRIEREASSARGKEIRSALKRRELGEWGVKPDRADKVQLIFDDEKSRIQELIPLRHERMAASPFAFYRGSALLMASDLAEMKTTGISVQACGDAHLGNFGIFASQERRLTFDINDFDETLAAPWDYDVRRLMASIEICGRCRGFQESQNETIVRHAAQMYQTSMRGYAGMGNLDVWYDHLDLQKMLEAPADRFSAESREVLEQAMRKAAGKTRESAFKKLTEQTDGSIRFRSNPPVLVPLRDMKGAAAMGITPEQAGRLLTVVLKQYRLSLPKERRYLVDQYRIWDVARKVVGVGSVGRRAWVIAMTGADTSDPLILQIKEAGESCLERYVGRSAYIEHGRRIVEGQRSIQTTGDILTGWVRIPDAEGGIKDYYVRQLWDEKGAVSLDSISASDLDGYAAICARTLAHAHAKTGNRYEIAGYLGKGEAFANAMASFARNYADQNEADYQVFLKKIGKSS